MGEEAETARDSTVIERTISDAIVDLINATDGPKGRLLLMAPAP